MAVIVYLHGFNSSPQSTKARQTADWLAQHAPQHSFQCPALLPYPAEAREQIDALVREAGDEVWLIGSSLGGFYATWLAARHDLPAVLINPSVHPYHTLRDYLGPNRNLYTDVPWEFRPEHIDELEAMRVEPLPRPQNFMVLVQTGDEVLDYREAENKYARGHLIVEEGGDHSFRDFDRHLPAILAFFESFAAARRKPATD